MGQGGRSALHAETASRGSEPEASPTGSKEIEQGGEHVEALGEATGFSASESSTDEACKSEGANKSEGGSQSEAAKPGESAE